MSTEPSTLRTANQLFDSPECTRIITMNNPNQNLHLERVNNGFRYIAGSPGVERDYSREFASLDDVDREIAPTYWSTRDAIWQDISDYPSFPYSALYLALKSPIELHILPDGEHSTTHGPHAIYGPVDISFPELNTYLLDATNGWLVVEYPAVTWRGGIRQILRPTRTTFDRLRLSFDNYRLRHSNRMWPTVRPSVIVVYGKPPADWQTVRQSLTAEQPASLR